MGTAVNDSVASITNQTYVPASDDVTVTFAWQSGDDASSVLHGGFNNILNTCLDVDITPDFNSPFLNTTCLGPVLPLSSHQVDVPHMSISATLYYRITALWDYGIFGQVWEVYGPVTFQTINRPVCDPVQVVTFGSNTDPYTLENNPLGFSGLGITVPLEFILPSSADPSDSYNFRVDNFTIPGSIASINKTLLGVQQKTTMIIGPLPASDTPSLLRLSHTCISNGQTVDAVNSYTVPAVPNPPSNLSVLSSVPDSAGGIHIQYNMASFMGARPQRTSVIVTPGGFSFDATPIEANFAVGSLVNFNIAPSGGFQPNTQYTIQVSSEYGSVILAPASVVWQFSSLGFVPASGLSFALGAPVNGKYTAAFSWLLSNEGQMFLDISTDSVFPNFVGKTTGGLSTQASGITESGSSDTVQLNTNTTYFARISTFFNNQFFLSPSGFPLVIFVQGATGGPIPKVPGDSFIVDMEITDDIPVDAGVILVVNDVNGTPVAGGSATVSLIAGTNPVRITAPVPSGLPVGANLFADAHVDDQLGHVVAQWPILTDPIWVIAG